MAAYFLRRIAFMLPTFLGITLVTFLVINLAPGGPIEQMLSQMRFGGQMAGSASEGSLTGQAGEGVNEEILAELKRQFGFDKPVLTRYGLWLWNLARLDFGISFVYDEPEIEVIVSKFPVSLQFGILSFIITSLVCIPLGIIKAVKDGGAFDAASSVLVFVPIGKYLSSEWSGLRVLGMGILYFAICTLSYTLNSYIFLRFFFM